MEHRSVSMDTEDHVLNHCPRCGSGRIFRPEPEISGRRCLGCNLIFDLAKVYEEFKQSKVASVKQAGSWGIDSWLTKLRARNPILGWTLTIVGMLLALVGSVLLLFVSYSFVVGIIPIVGIVLGILLTIFYVVGKYNKSYEISNLMDGSHGTVIIALSIVMALMAAAIFVLMRSH
jgi:hypothetical protein